MGIYRITYYTIFLFESIFSFNSNCIASNFKFTPEICKEYGLGKNWYCENNKKISDNYLESIKYVLDSTLPGEGKAYILESLRDIHTKRAVMDGHQYDIDAASEIQNILASKSVEFAKKMQKAVDSNPKFSVTHSNYKEEVEEEILRIQTADILKEAGKRYILIMIYNSSCLACQLQLPKVIRMKELWGFKNLGVSENRNDLFGFDEQIADSDVFKDNAIIELPTLLLLDTKNQEKIFLSKGITQVEEMENKILRLMKS